MLIEAEPKEVVDQRRGFDVLCGKDTVNGSQLVSDGGATPRPDARANQPVASPSPPATRQIASRTLPWLCIRPGVVLALCAGGALRGGRQSAPAIPEASAEVEATAADAPVGAAHP